MKTLILAAGKFGDSLRRSIEADREPRLDMFELAKELDADLRDFDSLERSGNPAIRLSLRGLGPSAALATLGYTLRHRYDAILTSGEDIGLPLAALLKTSRARCSHTMITHTLFPKKKRMFFSSLLNVEGRVDQILAHASTEERLMVDELKIPQEKVLRINYQADTEFFKPAPEVGVEPDLICAAGQLHRDYDCLIDAVKDRPIRLQVAAGSPWIQQSLDPTRALPPNVTWGKLNRFDLRALYQRSALAVVPIKQNEFQTGIATILEMMAMGKCIVCTKTRGQIDTIVDGQTGVYVPPDNPQALGETIARLLADPLEMKRIGDNARRFVEEEASLTVFASKVARAVRAATERRLQSR